MVPVIKNEKYTLTILDITSEGMGVGKIDDFTIFVPFTAVGDIIEALIVKVKSSYAYGKLLTIIEPSPHRATPHCSAFSKCGGCSFLHIKYAEQLRIKTKIVNEALSRIAGESDYEFMGILGMDNPFHYRNKMIFPVGRDKNNKIVAGFYSSRSHNIVPLSKCRLGLFSNEKILSAVLSYMNKFNVEPYSEESGTGLVRRIFLRHGYHTNETMVVICAAASSLPHEDVLVSELLNCEANIKSIILNISKQKTNAVLGQKNRVLYGSDHICDSLLGIRYTISPNSFFQINPVQTQKLYKMAIDFADLKNNDVVMDLYSGIGTISLSVAKAVKSVIGVEVVPDAISDAQKNAEFNDIKNAEFFCDTTENIVPKLAASNISPSTIILDPPRKGSDEKTLSAIVRLSPEKIVYVSCNPATLARDVKFLTQNGYKLIKVGAVDMFPGTVHVETVVLMSRKA